MFKSPKGVDPKIQMTKKEITDFYKKIENDPYFKMLPFPNFLVKQDPEKYSSMTKLEYENFENGIKYEDLLKEGKKDEAVKMRKEYLLSLPKPEVKHIHENKKFE